MTTTEQFAFIAGARAMQHEAIKEASRLLYKTPEQIVWALRNLPLPTVDSDEAADLLDQIGTRIAGLAYGLRHASTEITTTAQHCPSGVRAASGVVVPASLAGPSRPGEAG
jgi:hypothetical protein